MCVHVLYADIYHTHTHTHTHTHAHTHTHTHRPEDDWSSDGAAVIRGGVIVDTRLYLQGLWASCAAAGACVLRVCVRACVRACVRVCMCVCMRCLRTHVCVVVLVSVMSHTQTHANAR